jgi:hypothetical protein
MSAAQAETFAKRAKNASNSVDQVKCLVKAIEELAKSVKALEIQVSRLKRA